MQFDVLSSFIQLQFSAFALLSLESTMENFTPTSLASLSPLVSKLRATFDSGKTRDIEFRKNQLKKFWKLVDVEILHHISYL
jgi:hypothetical protein